MNAGAAESAPVQATSSPASNDAPPSSQSCQSCNPVKNHSSSDSRSFASIRGYFAYFAFFAFFVVPSRHSAKPPQPNFKFPISSFHSHSRPFVVPSPTLRPLRSLREIISRQARQARQEDIGLGAFSCLPFRVFRVFRSSRSPLGEAASAPSFKFQVSSFHSHSRPFVVPPLPHSHNPRAPSAPFAVFA